MMKTIVSFAFTLISLGSSAPAFSWAAEHPAGRPAGWSPNWPVGLRELMNSPGRVYGYFISANDFLFYSGESLLALGERMR